MSAPAWTAGPWEVAGQFVRTHYRMGDPDSAGEMIADCGVHMAERAANARLIAAAPDLVEALAKIRKCLDIIDPSRTFQYMQAMDAMQSCADAALTRAGAL